jgi:hypothetical protein
MYIYINYGFTDVPIQLFKKTQKEYTADQRDFALTLHLYGPKAYEFLRSKKNIDLPSTRTMARLVLYLYVNYYGLLLAN